MTEEQKPLEFLVIDDELTIRMILARVIQGVGENATTAVDGQDGIDKYVQMYKAGTPYDVAFIDYALPRGNGIDVVRAVKERYSKTLVYVITADVGLPDEMKEVSEKFESQLGKLKPNGFIPKPFNKDKLISFIEQIKLYKGGTITEVPQYQPQTIQS